MTESFEAYDAERHFEALMTAEPGRFAFSAAGRDDLATWQSQFREALREALGLKRMEAELAGFVPKAELIETTDMGSYIRERWRLLVEPTVPLPFYLLTPKSADRKLPLVLTPHGHGHPHVYLGIFHNPDEEAKIREGERDIAVQAVNEGYIVIAPTTRAFGETRTADDQRADQVSSCRIQLMHDLLVGRTPIGDRVWDMSRLIDWAVSREMVDTRGIAITGNSGGGTISLFAAACETRITVAVPSSYFNTFKGSIAAMRHCDCNYVPGMLRLGEMYDVAGLIAPRPFLAVAGAEDPIFPIEHARFAFEKLRSVYEVAGAEDRCELYVGDGGHRYYKERVWPFVREHFARDGVSLPG
jgi:dienelactone hydrolase